METLLIYSYIREYKAIKSTGFNLSSRYRVDFACSDEKDSVFFGIPFLKIEKNRDGMPHIFNSDIVDVKGVVGENGAGKTTLLEYLAFEGPNLPYGYWDPEYRDILIYEILDEGRPLIKIVVGSSWDMELMKKYSSIDCGHEFVTASENSFDDIEDFNGTDFIFFSNVFDNRTQFATNGLKLISTNYLVRQDQQTYANTKSPVNPLDAFKSMESKRQIEFVLDFKSVGDANFPFDLPKYLLINFNGLARSSLIRALASEKFEEKLQFLKEPIEKWLEASRDLSKKSPINYGVFLQREYCDYLIDNMIVDYSDVMFDAFPLIENYKVEVVNKMTELFSQNDSEIILSTIIAFVKEQEHLVNGDPQNIKTLPNGTKIQPTLGDSTISEYLRRFDDFYMALFDGAKDIFNFQRQHMVRRLDSIDPNLYELYRQTLFITTYLDFSFPDLSSGQTAFITLFSRFYSLNSYKAPLFNTIEEHKKTLVIFIDEGDLYFHPKWQSEFLYHLDTFLPLIFPGKRIQLIISSHSPFIASDLPVDNLLFLKNKVLNLTESVRHAEAGSKRIMDKDTTEVANVPIDTFAANIHELLSHSYFMKGAHIGAIAKRTLFKLIDQLDHKIVESPFSHVEILAIIHNVGESWMKSRLREKFDHYSRNVQS